MNYRKTFNRITLIAWSTIAVMIVMCSIAPHNAQANKLFYPPVNYDVGEMPNDVDIGDFNGDGNPDLAAPNHWDDNVSVLLGNGDGTFQSAVNYNVGDNPESVSIGDLNGDGYSDLAVANVHSDNVSVLLSNGDGTFQSAVNYGAGDWPRSVAIGDLNGDGILDLAATPNHAVSVLLGNGDGTFQSALIDSISVGTISVAIDDLNGDGDLDLAMGDYDDVSVLLGNGDGTFQSEVIYGAGDGPVSVAIGDLNGDGILDLAAANLWSDNVSVLLGNGDGTFQTAVNYGTISHQNSSVAIGDLDGDGDLDLAVATGAKVNVLLGNGDGTFQSAVNYNADYYPYSVAIGDLNGGGDLDLAVACVNSRSVSILINTGAGPKFVDVPPGYWAEDAIYKIYEAGITTGCSQDPLVFCPRKTVSRDQMAVFLGRATHDSNFTPPDATGIFADVPTWYWAADWIEQFYADGLTKGCKIDPHDVQAPIIYYCPEYPVTRTTMAIFLLRAKHGANYQPPPATGIFEDVGVNYWAADWIEQLYKEGITKGCKQDPLMFCPSKHVRRDVMAVFLARMLGL